MSFKAICSLFTNSFSLSTIYQKKILSHFLLHILFYSQIYMYTTFSSIYTYIFIDLKRFTFFLFNAVFNICLHNISNNKHIGMLSNNHNLTWLSIPTKTNRHLTFIFLSTFTCFLYYRYLWRRFLSHYYLIICFYVICPWTTPCYTS